MEKGKICFCHKCLDSFFHDIDDFLCKTKCVLEKVCRHIAFLINATYIEGCTVNIEQGDAFESIDALKALALDDANVHKALHENNIETSEASKALNENTGFTSKALNDNNGDMCETLNTE